MNAEDEAEFNDAHSKLAALRQQSATQEKFDAAVATIMPLVVSGIGVGATALSGLIPGGPIVSAGVAIGAGFLEDAIRRYLAGKAPKV